MTDNLKLWTGPTSGFASGWVGMSPGSTGALVPGQVKIWPWLGTGGQPLNFDLRYPLYIGNRFAREEAPGNTVAAATHIFSDTSPLAPLVPTRIIGACDLRTLSGEPTGTAQQRIDSLVLSYGTITETTTGEWNAKTIDHPLPGGTAAPASYWDNSAQPTKSVAQVWGGKAVMAVRLRETAARVALIDWLDVDPGRADQIMAITSDMADVTALVSAHPDLPIVYETENGYPGDGTHPTVETLATNTVYGVLVPAGNTNVTRVNEVRLAGLKYWTYVVDSASVAESYAAMGVEGIYTNFPTTVGTNPLPTNPDPEPPDPTPPPTEPTDPTPTPVNKGSWFGVTNANRTGLSGYKILRMFTGTDHPNGLVDSELRSTSYAKWISWKPKSGNMEGSTAVSLAKRDVDYLKTMVPKSVPCFMMIWHEPEGNKPSGWSVSRWIKAWQHYNGALYDQCVLARQQGYQFYVAPIICDWTHRHTSKGAAWEWYSADFTKYDVQGYDVYPTGQKASGSVHICRLMMISDYNVAKYADAARWDTYRYNRLCMNLAIDRGKHWGSGECGIIAGKLYGGDTLYRYTLEQRAQRFTDIHNDLLSLKRPPLIWTWWNNDSASVSTRTDPAGRAAYNKSFSTSPAGWPTPY